MSNNSERNLANSLAELSAKISQLIEKMDVLCSETLEIRKAMECFQNRSVLSSHTEMANNDLESLHSQATTGVCGTLSRDAFLSWKGDGINHLTRHIYLLKSSSIAPKDAIDLSEQRDRSVLGWYMDSILYLAGNNGFRLPSDCSSLFEGFDMLRSIDTADWDTSHVTSMRRMFKGCQYLNELDVSSWNTAQVTDMSYMFSGCVNLLELDVRNWNLSSLTKKQGIFDGVPGKPKLPTISK